MVERNPTLVDYLNKYQAIIDEYNRGKDENVIKDTFLKLIELVKEYTEEEALAKRQGLSDEQKAIFDILRKDITLGPAEVKEVKKVAISLLEELKMDKLNVDQWWVKKETIAAVYNFVNNSLFNTLPFPNYQDVDIKVKTSLVIEHLKTQYQIGGGSSFRI